MPQLNRQVGSPLVFRKPPTLDGYVVVKNSWKPKNMLKNEPLENEDEDIFNVSFAGRGTQVDCTLVQKKTIPPAADLEPSMVIDELSSGIDDVPPGSWVVLKADPSDYSGGRPIKFDVTLMKGPALDTTQQTAFE